jgi:hypothetical protein
VIIEKASQVLRAMATQKNGLMALSVVLSLVLHKAPSGSASMRLQWKASSLTQAMVARELEVQSMSCRTTAKANLKTPTQK